MSPPQELRTLLGTELQSIAVSPGIDGREDMKHICGIIVVGGKGSQGRVVKSSGFSRGASMYRGVTRHHQHGRWQARIGRVAGNKDLYLGTFSKLSTLYPIYYLFKDIAAIKFRGLNAVSHKLPRVVMT
ncbi:AP2-like ethylene-responsive transcription factor PLT1, partial [Cucurbita argyrosperma subsp. argyrosperma]